LDDEAPVWHDLAGVGTLQRKVWTVPEFLERIASAPISWGICEVPGWGAMLPTGRVLREMSGLGLTATELGAPGFLPDEPTKLRQMLDELDMTLLGGFTPVVLHDRALRETTVDDVTAVAQLLQRAGGSVFVTAAVLDPGWSVPRPLGAQERRHLVEMLGVLDGICAEHGLRQVLHPHVQTLVETADDVHRVLDTCDVDWCLDTGHLAIGGVDPVEFAKDAVSRVGHVHLKDVRLDLAPALMRREVSLMQATQSGLFTPLGQGDVDIAGVVQTLERSGYQGWYVVEQDTAITTGLPPEGHGPVRQVESSMAYLTDVVAATLTR
jgi:inosose dehydratase